MEVVFSSKNGFCPSFVYKNIKYYIKDRKRGTNDYVYSLYSWNTDKEILNFDSIDDAINLLKSKKNIKKCETYSFGACYEDRAYSYILKDKEVKIRENAIQVTSEFDTYEECLKFSKQYVADLIKADEPKQIKLVF